LNMMIRCFCDLFCLCLSASCNISLAFLGVKHRTITYSSHVDASYEM
jgi:hypothetical protein